MTLLARKLANSRFEELWLALLEAFDFIENLLDLIVSVDLIENLSVFVDFNDASPGVMVGSKDALPVFVDLNENLSVSTDLNDALPVSVDFNDILPVSVDLTENLPVLVDFVDDLPVLVDFVEDFPVPVDFVDEFPVFVDFKDDLSVFVDFKDDMPVFVDLNDAKDSLPVSVDLNELAPDLAVLLLDATDTKSSPSRSNTASFSRSSPSYGCRWSTDGAPLQEDATEDASCGPLGAPRKDALVDVTDITDDSSSSCLSYIASSLMRYGS